MRNFFFPVWLFKYQAEQTSCGWTFLAEIRKKGPPRRVWFFSERLYGNSWPRGFHSGSYTGKDGEYEERGSLERDKLSFSLPSGCGTFFLLTSSQAPNNTLVPRTISPLLQRRDKRLSLRELGSAAWSGPEERALVGVEADPRWAEPPFGGLPDWPPGVSAVSSQWAASLQLSAPSVSALATGATWPVPLL